MSRSWRRPPVEEGGQKSEIEMQQLRRRQSAGSVPPLVAPPAAAGACPMRPALEIYMRRRTELVRLRVELHTLQGKTGAVQEEAEAEQVHLQELQRDLEAKIRAVQEQLKDVRHLHTLILRLFRTSGENEHEVPVVIQKFNLLTKVGVQCGDVTNKVLTMCGCASESVGEVASLKVQLAALCCRRKKYLAFSDGTCGDSLADAKHSQVAARASETWSRGGASSALAASSALSACSARELRVFNTVAHPSRHFVVPQKETR